MISTICPFCNSVVETTESWAKENGRLFCNTCCKSFPVGVDYDRSEEADEQPEQEDWF